MSGVTYEILDIYRFLATELVFLDDFLLNYASLICHRDKIQKFENLQILEGVSTQEQSSGLSPRK